MKKVQDFLRRYFKYIILFICVICFLIIVQKLFSNNITTIDTVVYGFISKNLISDGVTAIMKFVTNLGGIVVLTSLVLVLFIILKNKKMWLCIALNLGIIALINQILKHIVQRPRPVGYRIIDESGYSFPSGHSMVSTAFYGFLIYLICKNVKNKYIKYISVVLLTFLILFIGTSRIYLGVHYASDVLAGFLISISYLIIFVSVINNTLLKETKIEEEK